MTLQRLRSFELAYRADELEDEHLRYLASGIPLLQVLELHRYAAIEPEDESDEDLPFIHITHTLMSIPNMRIAHLNFDLDHDFYHYLWHMVKFVQQHHSVPAKRGKAISDILSACPQFDRHTISAFT
ncbi:hypothetical protein BD413DRAFT_32526 [Trametes elegans]|nr:hypothetical protein BD413DRAFT_32526 [Trametes elegans]